MSGFVARRAYPAFRISAWSLAILLAGLIAGCGGGNDNGDPTTSFSGEVFSNAASRSRAPLPLAGASVTVKHYATGETLGSATTDSSGNFGLTISTLPPGTLIQIAAVGGGVTMSAVVERPTPGEVVRVDPETTIAALGIERIVTAGAPRGVFTVDSAQQVLNAVRAATAGGAVDLDTVDFRNSTEVDTAIDDALGPMALVTSNANARVYVDGIDTGNFAPHFEPNLTAGGHTFRVETTTQSTENSVNVPAGGAAWVDLTIISGGGSVPNNANYGGSMVFHLNDETINSPAAGLSVSRLEGFPDKRNITISLHGTNESFLNRAINISGVANVVSSDTLSGAVGSESGSTLRADFVSSTGTITQFSEVVESGIFTIVFNSDGTVSFSVNANSALLTGNASGTLDPFGP